MRLGDSNLSYGLDINSGLRAPFWQGDYALNRPCGIIFIMKGINWNEQWELHAPNFKEGYAHVNLARFGGPPISYRLLPGAGFGDLSHPTTQIMMHLLPKEIICDVLDIGCGSGVLSIGAKLLGAKNVYGLDIEPFSVEHAKKNALLNSLNIHFGEKLPSISFANPLILMNMISSEQEIAWGSLPELHQISKMMIVSGVLEEERNSFLRAHGMKYGKCVQELSYKGWLGFVFSRTASSKL